MNDDYVVFDKRIDPASLDVREDIRKNIAEFWARADELDPSEIAGFSIMLVHASKDLPQGLESAVLTWGWIPPPFHAQALHSFKLWMVQIKDHLRRHR